MYKVLETNKFVIYDDVFDKENFETVWRHVKEDEYGATHAQKWLKVWRLNDGVVYGSKSYEIENAPFNNYMDAFHKLFNQLCEVHKDLVGDWSQMFLRSYIYPRETKINWHNDQGYKAAIIFYTHQYWASTWGGELMLAENPPVTTGPNPCLDHAFEDKLLSHYGFGQYIVPKPNRLIITKGGVWHQISRVDKDAGDNCRCSIVGFLK